MATTRILPRTSSRYFEVARSWVGHLDCAGLAFRPGRTREGPPEQLSACSLGPELIEPAANHCYTVLASTVFAGARPVDAVFRAG
jgi:hypothetical protein